MLSTRFRQLLAPLAGAAAFAVAPLASAQEAPGQVQPVQGVPPGQPTVIVQQYQPPPVYAQPVYPQQPVYAQPVYQQPVMVAPGGYGVMPQYQPHVIRDWDESRPIPAGYHTEERVRRGLVIGGAVMFGTMYLLTALGAAVASDANGGNCGCGALYIPGVGPFVYIPQTSSATATFGLVLDGLVQLGGVAMFIGGLAAPTTVLVKNEAFDLKVEPMVGKDYTGTALVGHF